MERSNLKLRIDGLHPTPEVFNGKLLISLLNYMATLTEFLDSVGDSEAADLSTLTYYLDKELGTDVGSRRRP